MARCDYEYMYISIKTHININYCLCLCFNRNPSHTTQKTYDYSTTTSYIRRMLSPSKSFVSTTPTKDDQRSNTEHLKVSDAELVMWIFLHYCESHIVRSGRELMGVSSYTPVFRYTCYHNVSLEMTFNICICSILFVTNDVIVAMPISSRVLVVMCQIWLQKVT